MRTEILVSTEPGETRVAVLENHTLVELCAERVDQTRMIGDIYLGIVQSVIPGMQAAFIDLGQERAGFLHVSDTQPRALDECDDGMPVSRKPIEDILNEGQRILVQVVREQVGAKGPRLTTAVSLPGRYLVLIPGGRGIGISRRIHDHNERERLRAIGAGLLTGDVGLIVRTMAEGVQADALGSDVQALLNQWGALEHRRMAASAPAVLHREEGVGLSIVRDMFGPDVDRLIVADRQLYRAIVRYVEGISRTLKDRIEFYDHPVPLFEYFGIEQEVGEAFQRVVRLPRGGTLIIEQTEAMVVIDVNTGRYAGGQDQEETMFQTNMEAAAEIGRQLRLRDLGGIIVIDFIDMDDQAHREAVTQRLRDALRSDRAHIKVLPVSELGIVEMTRERVRPSLAETLLERCDVCGGTGRRMSLRSCALSLDRQLRSHRATGGSRGRLVVSRELQDYVSEHWGQRWVDICTEFDVTEPDDTPRQEDRRHFRIIPFT